MMNSLTTLNCYKLEYKKQNPLKENLVKYRYLNLNLSMDRKQSVLLQSIDQTS